MAAYILFFLDTNNSSFLPKLTWLYEASLKLDYAMVFFGAAWYAYFTGKEKEIIADYDTEVNYIFNTEVAAKTGIVGLLMLLRDMKIYKLM